MDQHFDVASVRKHVHGFDALARVRQSRTRSERIAGKNRAAASATPLPSTRSAAHKIDVAACNRRICRNDDRSQRHKLTPSPKQKPRQAYVFRALTCVPRVKITVVDKYSSSLNTRRQIGLPQNVFPYTARKVWRFTVLSLHFRTPRVTSGSSRASRCYSSSLWSVSSMPCARAPLAALTTQRMPWS